MSSPGAPQKKRVLRMRLLPNWLVCLRAPVRQRIMHEKSKGSTMRVASYSRYSSDLQDPRSTSDQINAAREYA
jgi:hypothetical protein